MLWCIGGYTRIKHRSPIQQRKMYLNYQLSRRPCSLVWKKLIKSTMLCPFTLYQSIMARECLYGTTVSRLLPSTHKSTSLYACITQPLWQKCSSCFFFLYAGFSSRRHTLWVFIRAETDCSPLYQLHPCSEVRCDEGSEPFPCMLPLPQG